MPNYDSISLESLSEFEQDVEMKLATYHFKSQEPSEESGLPDTLIGFTANSLQAVTKNSTIDGFRYLVVYQGYETSPIHEKLLNLLNTLSTMPPYSQYVKYGYLDLAHNDAPIDHPLTEALVLHDLDINKTWYLPVSSDIDSHEVDQWLRSNIYELMISMPVDDLDL